MTRNAEDEEEFPLIFSARTEHDLIQDVFGATDRLNWDVVLSLFIQKQTKRFQKL